MDRVRLDKWLWAARFFKTRTLAARACELSRIEANGQAVKAARDVRVGDLFVLASDGLTRLLSETEMASVRAGDDLEDLADRWLVTALERGAPDNLSFVLVRVQGL